jgi:hypothetical protein
LLAILKRSYGKIVVLVVGRARKAKVRIPPSRDRKEYIKIFVMLNISLLLVSVAILALTLGIPSSTPVIVINQPVSGNTTSPTNSSNGQQNQPNSSNPSSPIIVKPSNPDNSTHTPASTIKVGVYEMDPNGGPIKSASAIDWSTDGPILPGQGRNSPVLYFVNEGNVPVTLSLSSSAWSFKDSLGNPLNGDYQKYFSLTWDYDNSVLQLYQSKPVVLTLTISPVILDVAGFSFDLVISVNG